MNNAASYSVHFSTRYSVWFAVRATECQGAYATLEQADAKAAELNALL